LGQGQLARIAQHAGVEVVLINIPAGDPEKGDRGIGCLPSRMREFRDAVGKGIEYAGELGCKQMNCLAGVAPPDVDPALLHATYVSQPALRRQRARPGGDDAPRRADQHACGPGVFSQPSAEALALIDEVDADNLKLQYDLFHMRIMGDDLARTIEAHLGRIGHMQIADVPERHEPGTGEIDFPHLFDLIDRLGYKGWIGAEYIPTGKTADSLAWVKKYL